MPTPFYHIALAEEIMIDSRLTNVVADRLHNDCSAFLFGNIAPDCQTLSHCSRQSTHFYSVDNVGSEIAYEKMLAKYKDLSDVSILSDHHSSFVAGYLTHLLVDQFWKIDIFEPIFGKDRQWSDFQERMFLHNVLRIYLDDISYKGLSSDIYQKIKLDLFATEWLPFITNVELNRWYNFILEQLEDGASSKTLEVFTSRMSKTYEDFNSILASPYELEERVFSRISIIYLDNFYNETMKKAINMLNNYFCTEPTIV